jgi:hypothetical protein
MSSLFDNIPGPSPWYLRSGSSPFPGFQWQDAGDGALASGKTLLVGKFGPVAILDFYNYVVPLDDSTLLVWHQKHVESGTTAPVILTTLRPQSLAPLSGSLDSLYEGMKEQGEPLLLAGPPTSQISLFTSVSMENSRVEFPAEMRKIDELLILCHSSAVESNPGWEKSNLALLVAHPKQSSVQIYPQDWFNTGGLDYGYQWVTRVARDPQTTKIHGEGIRILPFVLDDSLRNLAK